MGRSLEITPNTVVCAPADREFKIAKHGRQQVIEVVRYATGHLTNHFHFLCLLKGCLGLPPFSDLLAQLFIRLFELACPLADQIFQMHRRCLALEEVVWRNYIQIHSGVLELLIVALLLLLPHGIVSLRITGFWRKAKHV